MVLASAAVAQQPVTRLDGSKIAPDEIDATVTRLMKAAEVTGVGIAILDHGKIAYLKAYGVRDKEKNLRNWCDPDFSSTGTWANDL
jgi:CubicO group peptidase (beta-lactamase class C family)